MSQYRLSDVLSELESAHGAAGGEGPAARRIENAVEMLRDGAAGDHYQPRVSEFQEAIRRSSGADYLSVRPEEVDATDRYDQPDWEAKEAIAERNRLFWAAFLNEEAGEVAGALTSGEPPEDFEEEVADVLIVAFGIADAFGFEMASAFAEKMAENETKPKSQDGTGKLPDRARGAWSRGDAK